MNRLVNELIKSGYLKSDIIIEAFSEIDRMHFVPEDMEKEAEANIPLPIGHGQTISQPLTVALMFELLDPKKGNNILDIGSGSGWTASLFSYIVGSNGKVTALERIPELCEFGKGNANKFNFIKNGIAEFHNLDGSKGYEKNSPYDRILVSAMADKIPEVLKKQLKVGGKMVIPVNNDIWYVEKKKEDDFYIERYSGFSFVPLICKSDD